MRRKNYRFRVSVANRRPQFSGFHDKRTMERTRDKVKKLIQCRKSGALTEEIERWLHEIENNSPIFYDRLSDLGLCEVRKLKRNVFDLINVFRKTRIKMAKSTGANFEHVAKNILAFFHKNTDITTITRENATAFEYWLRTTPLNKRRKCPIPYATANVNRRIKYVKQIFEYAVVIGWLERSPFTVLKGGKSVNPEKMCYIPSEAVYQVIQVVPLKWAAVIALGRFCGLRGPSEMYALKWKDIRWGDTQNPACIGIHCKKTKNHGKIYRSVPLYPFVSEILGRLLADAEAEEERIFPWMTPTWNIGSRVNQLFRRFLEYELPDPWYNLRRSFGCDLLESKTVDVFMYEEIMGHNYETGREHYQIMTRGRQRRGINAALGLYSGEATPAFSEQENKDGKMMELDAEKIPVSLYEGLREEGYRFHSVLQE